MEITDSKVKELSHLCRLHFDANQQSAIKQDLERILAFCKQLDQVNTDGVEPLVYMTEEQNNLREDTAIQSISKTEALKNAPSADGDYFKVPKVINK